MSSASEKVSSASASRWEPLWRAFSLLVSLGVVGVALWILWWAPFEERREDKAVTAPEWAKLSAPGVIEIKAGSPLAQKIKTVVVEDVKGSWPILTVTGFVVARLEKDTGKKGHPEEARWDFQTMEMATAYADWLKARADVPFTEKQLEKIRALSTARVTYQTKVTERMRKLVSVGTDAEKDLAKEESDLIQSELTAQKEVFEAETAHKNALRTRAALERQLYQAGVDPHLLLKGGEGMTLVVGEVPEVRISLVHIGQECEARFYAFPGANFAGTVGSLAPTLSKDRRTLRVFFQMADLQGRLKPGMFADVGLGTHPRTMRVVPPDAVVHVEAADYVLARIDADSWRIAEVKLGENHSLGIEVLSGLKAGAQIVGRNAILFKPLMARALEKADAKGKQPW